MSNSKFGGKLNIKWQKESIVQKHIESLEGICGEIAEYIDADSTIIQLLWILFVLIAGSEIILYLIAWIILLEKPEKEIISPS